MALLGGDPWLWTKLEVTAGDFGRRDPDVVDFANRGPRHELDVFGFLDLGGGAQQLCATPDDHAPAFGDIVVVCLKHHSAARDGGKQFGALGSSKQHGPVLHRIV